MARICLAFVCLALSLIGFATSQTVTTLVDGQWVDDTGISQGEFAYFSFEIGDVEYDYLNFTFIPCFGQFDCYIKNNTLPTTSNYDWVRRWQDGDQPFKYFTNPLSNQVKYVGVRALKNYKNQDSDALFNLIAYTNPIPDTSLTTSEKKISVDLSGSGSAKITFTPLAGATYKVYSYDGEAPDGAVLWTACGVQFFMKEVTGVDFTDASSGKAVAKFNVDDVSKITTVALVAQRTGYIDVVYNTAVFGAGFMAAPSALLVAALVALALFFSSSYSMA